MRVGPRRGAARTHCSGRARDVPEVLPLRRGCAKDARRDGALHRARARGPVTGKNVTEGSAMLALARDLCRFATGVVADENEDLFKRLGAELPFELHRYRSGDTFNGWVVPQNWRVHR